MQLLGPLLKTAQLTQIVIMFPWKQEKAYNQINEEWGPLETLYMV